MTHKIYTTYYQFLTALRCSEGMSLRIDQSRIDELRHKAIGNRMVEIERSINELIARRDAILSEIRALQEELDSLSDDAAANIPDREFAMQTLFGSLCISVRLYNVLSSIYDAKTVGDLIALPGESVFKSKGFGWKTFKELRDALGELGLDYFSGITSGEFLAIKRRGQAHEASGPPTYTLEHYISGVAE